MNKIVIGLKDTSIVSLLLSNAVVIFLAIWEGWDAGTVLWIYWIQSVIIGVFNFFRILGLKNFSTEGFHINGRPAQPNIKTKLHTAVFFLIHYGLFHFVYAIFLATLFKPDDQSTWPSFLLGIGVFFVNHLFSYWHNRGKDSQIKQNIGELMFAPYGRIVPMHLVLIFGATMGQAALILFLLIKTGADLIAHILKHGIVLKSELPVKISMDLN
jgi:hypothetical protein